MLRKFGEFGKLSLQKLVGGLDQTNELLYGTEEEIELQTKDAIENGFADGTGLILAPGCEISPQNSFDRIRASVKAAHRYGVWKD